MTNETSICQGGYDEYPIIHVIGENLLILIWVLLGTLGIWLSNPLLGIVYFTSSIFLIFIILRKIVCTKCYYYGRRCHTGWGKIAAFLFKKGDINDFNNKTGQIIPPITYMLLSITPIILLLVFLTFNSNSFIFLILILFILLSIFALVINRKISCPNCKMRQICPGSMAKAK